MRSLKLYEHPNFRTQEKDVSLLTTILFVLTLAMSGAVFILSLSCILFLDDCKTTYPVYRARPHFLTVQQVLSG